MSTDEGLLARAINDVRLLNQPLPPWIQVIPAEQIEVMAREDGVGRVAGLDRQLPRRAPDPTGWVLIEATGGVDLDAVKSWLNRYYGDSHPVRLLNAADEKRSDLGSISGTTTEETVVALEPLPDVEDIRSFGGLMNLTRTLRAPGGCPWDREQTHDSLKQHLLEEAYEVLDAIDQGDSASIADELGDLLFQVTIHSQVAAEGGTFTIEDVIERIMRKLTGRHPHVFGDLELTHAQDVLQRWESLKQVEKPHRESVLDEIPHGLPALPKSNLIQRRAASLGFEWERADQVIDKVEEEIAEVRENLALETDPAHLRDELGDVFFALVSVARHLSIDPEEALRQSNEKFMRRFRFVEEAAKKRAMNLRDLSPDALDELWRRAKQVGDDRG